MAKIQVTTADIQAKAEVIVLNSYFIAAAVRAHDTIDRMIEERKHVKQKYNEEKSKWEPVLDKDGKETYEYTCMGNETQIIEDRVYPLLKELMDALGIKPCVL